MSQLDQYVNASLDDWAVTSLGTFYNYPTIDAAHDNLISYDAEAYCLIDTSSIPDDATIDSATFYWYNHGYTAARGTTKHHQVLIGPSPYVTIYETTTYSDGAKSVGLGASALAKISKTGDTRFRFIVDDPGAAKRRLWYIRAYDGYSGANQQPRLVVNYTEASTGRKRSRILR